MTHAVVWIDHEEARIFHVHPEAADESTILSPQHHLHRHPKGRGEPREHPDDAKHFFEIEFQVERCFERASLASFGSGLARLPARTSRSETSGWARRELG